MKIDVTRWNEFAEAAFLNKKHDPWVKRKKHANIMIVSCEREDWWYAPFIGIECFVELIYNTYHFNPTVKYLKEANVVRIHGVMITSDRSISAKDFIIL